VFFFQAEDGIRDFHVTGVQTCALPICIKCLLAVGASKQKCGQAYRCWPHKKYIKTLRLKQQTPTFAVLSQTMGVVTCGKRETWRSEERRVGKECRPRRSRYE